MAEKTCPYCGTQIDENASRCYNCKAWLTEAPSVVNNDEAQDFLPTLLFAWFLGCFGVHRFYTGNFVTATVQLFTLGGCGIWSYIDFILICFGAYKDAQGRNLQNYNRTIGVTIFVISLIPLVLIIFFILLMILAVGLAGATH